MKLSILHNAYQSLGPSGENEVVNQEFSRLQKIAPDVQLILANSDKIFSGSLLWKIRLTLQSVLFGYPTITSQQRKRIAASDVVHLHNSFPAFGFNIVKNLKKRQKYVVMSIHNARLSCLNGSHSYAGKACFRCVDKRYFASGVIRGCYRQSKFQSLLYSRYTRLFLRDFHLVDHFIVLNFFSFQKLIDLGVSDKRISIRPTICDGPSKTYDPQEKGLLFAGRLTEEKGVDLLIQAWVESTAPKNGWKLYIAGEGPLRKRLESKFSPADGVIFLGMLSEEKISEAIRNCRIVSVPSKSFEGFPSLISKSAANGRPVVISNVGPLAELSGLDWITSLAAEVEVWREYFNTLNQDSYSYKNLSARDWWEREASPSRADSNLLKIYEDLKMRKLR